MKIPRTMSTQHPDNVRSPFFAENHILSGDNEIKEAFYRYAHLGIKEQLWDFEGKDVDSSVVRKLLMKYEPFFREKKLGKDLFLTYRVPNPDVDKNEGKILLETLESIPRSSDTARLFYGDDIAPIFEVAIPMVTDATSLIRVAEYYKRFVVAKENSVLFPGDDALSSWVGRFKPEQINVIPLMEDKDSILNADKIVKEYLVREKVKEYQRVWLARSDPALNYGSLPTVLIEKIGLQRLDTLSQELSLDIPPILGCGSAPFRGNFKPGNVEGNMKAYPSVQTFTLQSAFKYDYHEGLVRDAVETIEAGVCRRPLPVDESCVLPIIDKVSAAYQEQIKLIAPLVNDFSKHIPRRRKRKLHIGLFGYSRNTEGVRLPRAISFCASLYSLGLPPELLGMHTVTSRDVDVIKEVYPTFMKDLGDAAQFLNNDNLSFFPGKIGEQVKEAVKLVDVAVHEEHKKATSEMLQEWKSRNAVSTEHIERAGWMRGFLW